jgi:hypothetical protein
MNSEVYHNFLELDSHIEGLELVFEGLTKALSVFDEKFQQNWYNGDFYREETELIYGVALVSLQNYINKCCVDFMDAELFGFNKMYKYYEKNSLIISENITQIRLIVELANYFKHRDDERGIIKETKITLQKLDLYQFHKSFDERFENELIFNGLFLLNASRIDINILLDIAKKWRTDTWAAAYIE